MNTFPKLSIFLTLLAILSGSTLAQGRVLTCPKGAVACSYNVDKPDIVNVAGCYQSIMEIDAEGNQSCNFNVDLSQTNGQTYQTFTVINQFQIESCLPGYALTVSEAKEVDSIICMKSTIPGSLIEYVQTKDYVLQNRQVLVCKNGYPNQKLDDCILRGSEKFNQPSLKLLGQSASPLNVNCDWGFSITMGQVFCIKCKEGWMANAQTQTVSEQCYKPNKIIPGCMFGQGDVCLGCNNIEGWLPVDSNSSSCYKM